MIVIRRRIGISLQVRSEKETRQQVQINTKSYYGAPSIPLIKLLGMDYNRYHTEYLKYVIVFEYSLAKLTGFQSIFINIYKHVL